jgi:hypothetical protein
MRALIVYESMYGNTRAIAEHIATGIGDRLSTAVVPVAAATPDLVEEADLLVCGAPTHVRGLPRPRTRQAAAEAAPAKGLTLELDSAGPGLREWLDALGPVKETRAAAFDTRLKAPVLITGRASKGIARQLRRHGFTVVAGSTSFLVDKETRLIEGEAERAEQWGRQLAATIPAERDASR